MANQTILTHGSFGGSPLWLMFTTCLFTAYCTTCLFNWRRTSGQRKTCPFFNMRANTISPLMQGLICVRGEKNEKKERKMGKMKRKNKQFGELK